MTEGLVQLSKEAPTRAGAEVPRLVFVHGFLDGSSVWADVIEGLSPLGVRIDALNLPGMGGVAARVEDLTLDYYVAHVRAFLGDMPGPVILVGQSLGSQVVDLVATRYPELVAGLVLLTPIPLAGAHLPEQAVAPFKRCGGDTDLQSNLRRQLSYQLDGGQLQTLMDLGLGVERQVVARLVELWNEGSPEGLEAGRYEGPVLILRGRQDPFIGEEIVASVQGRYPQSRVAVVEHAGHWPHIEAPSVIAAAITGFLAGLNSELQGGGAKDWQSAFASRSSTSFEAAFAEDVEVDAVVLRTPIRGREQVKAVMEAASQQYRELHFTENATAGLRQYLEWRAIGHDGMEYRGITILTRNQDGQVAEIAIHHRPIEAAMHFSRKLAETMAGAMSEHFL